MPIDAIIGGATSLLGGILGSGAAGAASEQEQRAAQQAITQEQAAKNQALGVQNTNYGQAQGLLNPYVNAGQGALGSLGNLLGIGSPSGAGGYGSLLQGYGSFQAPTLQQAENQPGYQFALQQGLNALQNSAAARGTLLSGGTAAGIQQYGQQAAEQNYGNVFNQSLAAYQNNAQNYYQNQANQYNRLMGLTGAGQGAASNLAGLGEQYAGMGTHTIMGAANNVGNYLLDKGTAAAQGSLGQANAWQGALNGIGQLGQIYGGGMNMLGGGGQGGGGFSFPSNTVSDLGGYAGPGMSPYSSSYQLPAALQF